MQNTIAGLSLKDRITHFYRYDETDLVKQLTSQTILPSDQLALIRQQADELVLGVRHELKKQGAVDTFMQEYELGTEEGVLMMCLAEALLRIPDAKTANELLHDKLGQANFSRHLKASSSSLVNFSSWALHVTGKVLKDDSQEKLLSDKLKKLLSRSSEPFVRRGALYAMRLLADKFVIGRNIEKALKRAKKEIKRGYAHSFDMLGEAAFTARDAERYFTEYTQAIQAIAADTGGQGDLMGSSISIKLSALYPRYEYAKRDAVLDILFGRLLALCQQAKAVNISLTIDAEEAARLEISLELFEMLSGHPTLAGWNGLGLAVQAYQKRALAVIDWLAAVAHRHQRRINVRLVKGAYWDTEIKLSQMHGYKDYPVFTRKSSTDISYIACAKKLLTEPTAFYPAFATHNAYTVATIMEMAKTYHADYEFQKLHGMGDALYDQIVGTDNHNILCRIYAPVGNYKELLPYLVRRLLENGANSSFVNLIGDERISLDELNVDPIQRTESFTSIRHPAIPLPQDLYGNDRLNSQGIDLSNPLEVNPILESLETAPSFVACSIVAGKECCSASCQTVVSPFDNRQIIGEVHQAQPSDIKQALEVALKAADSWTKTSAPERAECLKRMADLMEENRLELIQLCVYEGGKTLADAIAEIREAIDFCRYYAVNGLKDFGSESILPGPTGELNTLRLDGRGVFVCISPWNFPLAIFIGQITAALMAGNTVIAKPAGQTPLIAAYAIKLLHQAGIPVDALHLLIASGRLINEYLLTDPRIAGMAFTGSTETAWNINQTLAQRRAPIIPLIAETGGQNIMLVDSSALIEQVVSDVLTSSFQSAGQRCSALRAIFIQEDITPHFLETLSGAMAELQIGNPALLSTDIGPVIDQPSANELKGYCDTLRSAGKLVYETPLVPGDTQHGSFVAPIAFEIDSANMLTKEQFGPVLHIIRYQASYLDQVIDTVNNLGYGLTFGLHTRIDRRVKDISDRIKVGNVYINRNMIGAVVGVQPFGGHGLSGTGPKAGGPHYLHRFAAEKTISINITAQGGNTKLMALKDE